MEVQIAQWIEAFSYPAVFLLLLLCGVGAPLSEDLVLLTGGVVVSKTGASLPGMMVAGYLGILVGDSLLFWLGKKLGPRLLAHPWLARMLKPSRVTAFRQMMDRRGLVAVFLARFLPGLRAPAYLLAGTSGMPYRRFLLADGLAAWPSSIIFTWLGHRFGRTVLKDVGIGMHWVLVAMLALVLLSLAGRWWRRRRARVLTRRIQPSSTFDSAEESH